MFVIIMICSSSSSSSIIRMSINTNVIINPGCRSSKRCETSHAPGLGSDLGPAAAHLVIVAITIVVIMFMFIVSIIDTSSSSSCSSSSSSSSSSCCSCSCSSTWSLISEHRLYGVLTIRPPSSSRALGHSSEIVICYII